MAPLNHVTNARPDPLEHFRGEGPGWKLAALVVCRLPYIVAAATGGFVLWQRYF